MIIHIYIMYKVHSSRSSTLSLWFFTLLFLTFTKARDVGPVKNAFYKILSVLDNSALTATWTGRPRAVIASSWRQDETQEWKVKSKKIDGIPLQLIRNEAIRDNEITKEENFDLERNKNAYVPINWNFLKDPSGAPNVFALNNGFGCVVNNGYGKRISIEPCDPASTNQQWEFVYLYEIPRVRSNIE